MTIKTKYLSPSGKKPARIQARTRGRSHTQVYRPDIDRLTNHLLSAWVVCGKVGATLGASKRTSDGYTFTLIGHGV